MNHIDWELVNWSRAQFALTAMYHWLFVPLTLGTTFMIAIMETIYVKTQDEKWKEITKFWMKLFGINFAIGVATGIILEFEFGTNWSNYSWFVGDIFGAPLAIEGIMAFFMESTFIAVMFFGWDRVSQRFHLTSSWLVAIGSNLSALWILVANGWMQNPVGVQFNPDTMRNEMIDFWAVLLNPVAVNKFLHTVISSYIVSALFVVGVSSWFLLKRRDVVLAKRSILVATVFGLLATIGTFWSGDESARQVAKTQPMKLAAMEGLYEGDRSAPLIAMGIFGEQDNTVHKKEQFLVEFQIPKALSYLAFLDSDKFVPGISDLVHGNKKEGIPSYDERISSGKIAIDALRNYGDAKKTGNLPKAEAELKTFRAHEKDFGYGYYFGKNPHLLIPNVKISFYSFHIMVILGTYFLVLFILLFVKVLKGNLDKSRTLLRLTLWSIPLGYIASQSGWVVAEVGRQPWTIQNLLPNIASVSQIDAYSVQITFFLFLIIFTTLLIAEIKIMLSAIRKGSQH